MKKVKSFSSIRIAGAFIGLILYLISPLANAASLGLSPSFPDLVVFDGSYDYTYQGATPNPNDIEGGTLTVTNGLMALNPDGSGNIPVSGGSYELIANFGVNGLFIDGTVSALGTTADPDFLSGTIVSGDLLEFGFSGIDQAGSIEFTFDNVGGDMAAFGSLGGVIIDITDMFDGISPYSGAWDPSLDNNPAFWQRNFSGTALAVDTFVPVPAAVWLFGSGLVALFSLARVKRTA